MFYDPTINPDVLEAVATYAFDNYSFASAASTDLQQPYAYGNHAEIDEESEVFRKFEAVDRRLASPRTLPIAPRDSTIINDYCPNKPRGSAFRNQLSDIQFEEWSHFHTLRLVGTSAPTLEGTTTRPPSAISERPRSGVAKSLSGGPDRGNQQQQPLSKASELFLTGNQLSCGRRGNQSAGWCTESPFGGTVEETIAQEGDIDEVLAFGSSGPKQPSDHDLWGLDRYFGMFGSTCPSHRTALPQKKSTEQRTEARRERRQRQLGMVPMSPMGAQKDEILHCLLLAALRSPQGPLHHMVPGARKPKSAGPQQSRRVSLSFPTPLGHSLACGSGSATGGFEEGMGAPDRPSVVPQAWTKELAFASGFHPSACFLREAVGEKSARANRGAEQAARSKKRKKRPKAREERVNQFVEDQFRRNNLPREPTEDPMGSVRDRRSQPAPHHQSGNPFGPGEREDLQLPSVGKQLLPPIATNGHEQWESTLRTGNLQGSFRQGNTAVPHTDSIGSIPLGQAQQPNRNVGAGGRSSVLQQQPNNAHSSAPVGTSPLIHPQPTSAKDLPLGMSLQAGNMAGSSQVGIVQPTASGGIHNHHTQGPPAPFPHGHEMRIHPTPSAGGPGGGSVGGVGGVGQGVGQSSVGPGVGNPAGNHLLGGAVPPLPAVQPPSRGGPDGRPPGSRDGSRARNAHSANLARRATGQDW